MWNRKSTPAGAIALGGVLAAVSVIIMGLGGMIPVATYVCPAIVILVLQMVLLLCGRKIAWAWYGVVAILSALMSPDKEAAFVFVFMGYYPILKPWMDSRKLPWIYKGLFFNAVILALYYMLLHLMGMDALQQEFAEMGTILTVILLLLGNVTFFMLDFILGKKLRRRRKNHG